MELEREPGICRTKAKKLRLLSEKVVNQLKNLNTEEAFDIILEIEKIKKCKFTECNCKKVRETLNVVKTPTEG